MAVSSTGFIDGHLWAVAYFDRNPNSEPMEEC